MKPIRRTFYQEMDKEKMLMKLGIGRKNFSYLKIDTVAHNTTFPARYNSSKT